MTKVKKKKNVGKYSRDKGHRKERELAKVFRDIGFKDCKTSRQASRLLDDSKVDLWGIPFNVQVKSGYQRGINYSKLFEEITEKLKENFPTNDLQIFYPKMIIHSKGRKENEKFVIMQQNEFFKLIEKLNDK